MFMSRPGSRSKSRKCPKSALMGCCPHASGRSLPARNDAGQCRTSSTQHIPRRVFRTGASARMVAGRIEKSVAPMRPKPDKRSEPGKIPNNPIRALALGAQCSAGRFRRPAPGPSPQAGRRICLRRPSGARFASGGQVALPRGTVERRKGTRPLDRL